MGFVYHGSQIQNLTEIIPINHRPVFATPDKIISALFAINREAGHGTFSRTIGHIKDGTMPFIAERYSGAFDELYSGMSGSIYVLDDSNFVPYEKTKMFKVSRYSVPVIQEIKITDMKQYLLNLAVNNELKIYTYPTRPSTIPDDDSDLVQMCIRFNNPEKLQEFRDLFPDLYHRNKEKFADIEHKKI